MLLGGADDMREPVVKHLTFHAQILLLVIFKSWLGKTAKHVLYPPMTHTQLKIWYFVLYG